MIFVGMNPLVLRVSGDDRFVLRRSLSTDLLSLTEEEIKIRVGLAWDMYLCTPKAFGVQLHGMFAGAIRRESGIRLADVIRELADQVRDKPRTRARKARLDAELGALSMTCLDVAVISQKEQSELLRVTTTDIGGVAIMCADGDGELDEWVGLAGMPRTAAESTQVGTRV